MLRTRLSERFGLELPVLNAPMGGTAAGGRLAAAVSLAGGLGMIGGMGNGVEWLREQIRYVRERTDRPFGVGFISHWLPDQLDLYQAALDEGVPVVMHSFTDPAPYMDAARASGAAVICQVRDLEGALQAARAGVDVIVAQGTEAGGHTGRISTLPLVPQVVDAVAPLPVLAAGGIADGRGLAAALMLGAEGVVLGTALLATDESGYGPNMRRRIVEMGSGETVLTDVFDIVRGSPWPRGVSGRVARNRFSDRWHGREEELRTDREAALAQIRDVRDDPELNAVWAGESAGMVRGGGGAGDVVRRIAADAERMLRERALAIVDARA